MVTNKARQIINSIKPNKIPKSYTTPLGEIGYDNARDDIEKVKHLREGTIEQTPTQNNHIVNKEYADFIADAEASDHVAIHKSDANAHQALVTLAGTPNYLTLAGQAITLTKLDITDDTNFTAGTNCTLSTNTLNVDDAFLINSGNDTTTGILTAVSFVASGSSGTSAQWDTAYTHSQDNTQAHSDYLLNSGADVAVGPLTITADNSTADQAYVPMVLYNTDATPPTASNFPRGTIYIQYTA